MAFKGFKLVAAMAGLPRTEQQSLHLPFFTPPAFLGRLCKKKDSVPQVLTCFKGKNNRPNHCVAVRDEWSGATETAWKAARRVEAGDSFRGWGEKGVTAPRREHRSGQTKGKDSLLLNFAFPGFLTVLASERQG